MLEYVKEVLPMGPDQWEDVGVLSRNHFVGSPYPRETESLKQKFKTLRLVRKPTGNPTCPPEVREAKRIQKLIEQHSDIIGDGDSSGQDDDEAEDGSEDEEDDDLLDDLLFCQGGPSNFVQRRR